MSLEDRLERLATRKPEGDPADVLAAARARAESPPAARPSLLAAAVAVVALAAGAFALAGGTGDDSVTVAGPDADRNGDAVDAAPTVSVSVAGMGPLDASVSPLGPSGTGWLEHTVTLENTGDSTVYVRDLRKGTFLGDTEVATATQGCGYGPDSPLGLRCVTDLRVVTVDPGGTHTFTVALWRDLPGMNPVGDGPYDWGLPVSYSTEVLTEPDDAGTTGTVTLTYENLASELPDGVERTKTEGGGVDGPVMFVPESQSDGTRRALLGGRLLLDGDCLFFESEGDRAYPRRYLVLWPHGSSWDAGAGEVVVPGGTRVPLGSDVTAAGGYLTLDALGPAGHHPDVVARAEQCAVGGVEVAHVQGDVRVTATPSRLSVPEAGASGQQLSDGTPVWVVRHDDRTVSVVDAVSTHRPFGAGTLVAWCGSSGGFVDPMYGSLYDAHGRKQAGPAPSGLPTYPVVGTDENSVTVRGAPVEQPRLEDGGDPASSPAGPGCFDVSDGDSTSFIEGSYETHSLASLGSVTPEEAVRQADGAIAVIDAPVVIVEGREATACTSPVSGNPPTCDGVPTLGLMLHDQASVVLRGTFVARIDRGALTGIAYVGERSAE